MQNHQAGQITKQQLTAPPPNEHLGSQSLVLLAGHDSQSTLIVLSTSRLFVPQILAFHFMYCNHFSSNEHMKSKNINLVRHLLKFS
jgi:hypothetical protein